MSAAFGRRFHFRPRREFSDRFRHSRELNSQHRDVILLAKALGLPRNLRRRLTADGAGPFKSKKLLLGVRGLNYAVGQECKMVAGLQRKNCSGRLNFVPPQEE